MPKKIIISEIGGPEVLKYIEYDIPNAIKEDDVRIQQTAIGINYIDTYHRSGIYPLPNNLPICPGLEASGRIIKLGSRVKNFKIGDKVCYAAIPIGAYCQVRDFPALKVIKVPNKISEETAIIFLK